MDDMKFSEQLKFYRKSNNFSQEELAEKIYVSRQTISNWENKKSFPDIHNLLLLSVLFDVSLDNLVKGEMEEIKNVSNTRVYRRIARTRDIFAIASVFLMIFGRRHFGNYFSIIMGILTIIVFIISRIVLRKIEKNNNIENTIYNPKEVEEVLLFLENPNLAQEKFEKKRKQEQDRQSIKWFIQVGAFLVFIILSAYISRLFYL